MSDFNPESSVPVSTPAATPETVAPSANPATPDANAAPQATPQGTPAAAPTSQTPPEPSWLRGRLQQTREAAIRQATEQFNAERAQLQAQFEAQQRQLHALVGVAPQADPEVAAIRSQFEKLFPGLAKLEARANDFEGLLEQSGGQSQQIQHYWSSYGRQQMDRLFDMAGKSLNGNLSDGAKRQLHAAFSSYVTSSPEASQRYAEDPTFVDEFWQEFQTSLIDPVRRGAAATVETQTNRAMPQDTPGGVPQMQPAPKPGSLDERMNGAWASFNAAKQR